MLYVVAAVFVALCTVYNVSNWFVWSLFAFMIGFALCFTVLSALESIVVTLFVCLAQVNTSLYITATSMLARCAARALQHYKSDHCLIHYAVSAVHTC